MLNKAEKNEFERLRAMCDVRILLFTMVVIAYEDDDNDDKGMLIIKSIFTYLCARIMNCRIALNVSANKSVACVLKNLMDTN